MAAAHSYYAEVGGGGDNVTDTGAAGFNAGKQARLFVAEIMLSIRPFQFS